MKRVFADTAFYIGLLRRSDGLHERCVGFDHTYREGYLTSEFVLIEFGSWLAGTAQRRSFPEFVRRLQADPRTLILPATSVWVDRGMRLYEERPDKGWSMIDCISFEMMREHSVAGALTADRHFAQAGFEALLATE